MSHLSLGSALAYPAAPCPAQVIGSHLRCLMCDLTSWLGQSPLALAPHGLYWQETPELRPCFSSSSPAADSSGPREDSQLLLLFPPRELSLLPWPQCTTHFTLMRWAPDGYEPPVRQAPSTVPMEKARSTLWANLTWNTSFPLCAESRLSSPLTPFLSLVSFPWDPG